MDHNYGVPLRSAGRTAHHQRRSTAHRNQGRSTIHLVRPSIHKPGKKTAVGAKGIRRAKQALSLPNKAIAKRACRKTLPAQLGTSVKTLVTQLPSALYSFVSGSTPQQTSLEGTGLKNRGNTCFINSAMQLLSDHLHQKGIFQADMMNREVPASIQQELKGKVSTFTKLREDTLALCQALSPGMKSRRNAERLMDNFVKSYQAFAKASGRSFANSLFGSSYFFTSYAASIQQDSQEFMNDLCQILDLNDNETTSLIQCVQQSLVWGGFPLTTRLQYRGGAEDRSAMLSVEAETQPGHPLTLQNCLDNFLSQEEMTPENRLHWNNTDLVQAGIIHSQCGRRPREQTTRNVLTQPYSDCRQMKLFYQGATPPQRLLLQVKIFTCDKTYHPIKLDEQGRTLLRSADEELVIPVHSLQSFLKEKPKRNTWETPSLSPPVMQPYRVSSIIAHSGNSASSGHYYTVRFNRGAEQKTTICDDSSIHTDNSTLEEYLKNGHDCGYLYSLEASGPPRPV